MREVGSGTTVRGKPDLVPATPENVRALMRSIGKSATQPWGGYADVIAFARLRLEEIKAEAPSIHDDLDGYNSFFVERHSEGWYIESVVIEAAIAEKAIEQARPWEAVACAMRIGELLTEARMKRLWEGPAVVGANILAARARSRDDANERRRLARESEWVRWNKCAATVWAQHPDWGAPAVAKRVKDDLQLDEQVDTIRKRIKKAGTAG